MKVNRKMYERKPHRQFCSICGEVSRVDFSVPNEIWERAVHISQINSIICLRCFTIMADERGVEWDKKIDFFPCSLVEQLKIVENAKKYLEGKRICDFECDAGDGYSKKNKIQTCRHRKIIDKKVYCIDNKTGE